MKNLEREFTDREYLILSGKLPGHQRRQKKADIPRLCQDLIDQLIESDQQLMEILRREQEELDL